jgi:hypothetical protein
MPVTLPIKSTVNIQMPGLVALQKAAASTSQRSELLGKWADEYFASIHARHNILSEGGGSQSGQRWRPLAPATVELREKRLNNKKYSKWAKPKRGTTAILADTLQLLGATRKKGGPGQLRSLVEQTFTITVGIGGSVDYREPTPNQRKHPRRLGTIAKLQRARGRDIISLPNKRTLAKMESLALVWILKRYRESNKSK